MVLIRPINDPTLSICDTLLRRLLSPPETAAAASLLFGSFWTVRAAAAACNSWTASPYRVGFGEREGRAARPRRGWRELRAADAPCTCPAAARCCCRIGSPLAATPVGSTRPAASPPPPPPSQPSPALPRQLSPCPSRWYFMPYVTSVIISRGFLCQCPSSRCQ